MKKWMIAALMILCTGLSFGQSTPQELWTYTGVADNTLLSTVPSETGTGSAFGTGAPFLTVVSGRGQIKGALDFAQSLSPAQYAGQTDGVFQISYEITAAAFIPSGSGQFGWGLRSNAGGTSDCKVFFQQLGGSFQLVVHDAAGARAPVVVAPVKLLSGTVTIRQTYLLDIKGTPGSFQVYYSYAGGEEQELYSGQLSLPADFQLDEFLMEITAKSSGFNWAAGNTVSFDNLALNKLAANPDLALIGQKVSFIQDNGIIDNSLYPTYEPGDVLQIITTNQNIGLASANNVTTSLSVDPAAFTITPLTNTFNSIGVGETYLSTFQVQVLDGALDGANTFTVINQIGAGADAIVFKDEIK